MLVITHLDTSRNLLREREKGERERESASQSMSFSNCPNLKMHLLQMLEFCIVQEARPSIYTCLERMTSRTNRSSVSGLSLYNF